MPAKRTISLQDEPGAEGAADEVPLQVNVPRRIKRALDMRAAETGQTKRSIVLEGLRRLDFDLTDDEVAGPRGTRRR